jgi:hypothetical protein
MELWDFFSTGSAFRTTFALGQISLAHMGRFYYTAVIWPLIVRRLRRKSYNPLSTFSFLPEDSPADALREIPRLLTLVLHVMYIAHSIDSSQANTCNNRHKQFGVGQTNYVSQLLLYFSETQLQGSWHLTLSL